MSICEKSLLISFNSRIQIRVHSGYISLDSSTAKYRFVTTGQLIPSFSFFWSCHISLSLIPPPSVAQAWPSALSPEP